MLQIVQLKNRVTSVGMSRRIDFEEFKGGNAAFIISGVCNRLVTCKELSIPIQAEGAARHQTFHH